MTSNGPQRPPCPNPDCRRLAHDEPNRESATGLCSTGWEMIADMGLDVKMLDHLHEMAHAMNGGQR